MAYVGGRMKLDHCLFGYDDGHRLIASSLPLGEESAYLTELSDLAPGVVFGSSKGYWTGSPAPSIGRYVLMYTWPAPEMPRPGCVWTHALLLEPAMLESIEDLSILQGVITRPSVSIEIDYYRQPLEVDLNKTNSSQLPLDITIVEKLIDSLYGRISTNIEVLSSDRLDQPLFAVWSQQWPKLRRNFRFQTAASRMQRPTGSARFDIIAIFSQDESNNSESENISSSWLNNALTDVQSGGKTSLRTFLWEYGRDVRKQRGSFRPLAEIHSLGYKSQVGAVQRIINIISESFPTLNDAKHLKQHLVDGILAGHEQIMLITNIMLSGNEKEIMFPAITMAGVDNLIGFWPQKAKSVLDLFILSSHSSSESGRVIFESLIETIQSSDFWTLSYAHPIARKIVTKRNPEFLLATGYKLDDVDVISLLPLVPSATKGLSHFINDMISRDNKNIASMVFDYFPDIAVAQVVQRINVKTFVPKVWKKKLLSQYNYLLKDEVIRTVTHSSLLFDIADALGWLSDAVIVEGLEPWYNSLMTVTNDLDEQEADMLDCFFIVLAIKNGGDKGLHVIEKLYINLHHKILKSKLSQKSRDMLSQQLPDVGWLRGWDLGYRFRLAIAKAYICNRWPVESYVGLASDSKGRELLADAASDVEGGREYSNAAWRY
ncbi:MULTISPECIES: GAP1-N1 domain-containing protein [unclassified Enterobacter]|uniref:GAP1-N1 domain-containing protein n=1 Tax=unclassified Enterobacter TaxID=2608935 RepID=UPI0004BA1F43|nr:MULTISPECIES: hypothetical protein [unclassified Enterobacter]EBG2006502.1 hypothetical protein [Salmonella enterica]